MNLEEILASAEASVAEPVKPAPNITVALGLAKSGLPVFPARCWYSKSKDKWEKAPLVEGWQQLATIDSAQIHSWWQQWPDAVVGIQLGRADLAVIDPDRHGDEDGVAAFAEMVASYKELLPHPISNTAGGGQHHYFRQMPGEKLGNSPGNLPKGIDVRGVGGWTVAPGCYRADGKQWSPAGLAHAYQNGTIPIIPDWLYLKIRPPRKEPSAQPTSTPRISGSSEAATELSSVAETDARSALNRIPSDNRDTWFRIGAALHSTGWECAREIWDAWSQATPGKFDPVDQAKTWHSFSRGFNGAPITIKSLFALAIENGWQQPMVTESPRQIMQTVAEFLAGYICPNYVVDGLLKRGFLYSLTAMTGAGKTAIALLIAEIASNRKRRRKLGQHEVEHVRVIYIACENADDVRARLIGMESRMDFDRADLDMLVIDTVFDLAKNMDRIRQDAEKFGGNIGLVIIDTSAAMFAGQDENNNPQMLAHAKLQRSLCDLPGRPCVLALNHPIKHASSPDQLLPRGGGAYLNEIDGNLTAWTHGERLTTLHWAGKIRGPDFEGLEFRLPTIHTDKLVDGKGRMLPTVMAEVVSHKEIDEDEEKATVQDNKLLRTMLSRPDGSIAQWAQDCGWVSTVKPGEEPQPYKSLVYRVLKRLGTDKLVTKNGRIYALTKTGKALAEKGSPVPKNRSTDLERL